MWFFECPSGDQGLLRPLRTELGRVVLLCDVGGEVWLDPGDVESARPRVPGPPTWEVAPGVIVQPGTTRWAELNELPPHWREDYYLNPGPNDTRPGG